ncbi:hypothetical protein NI17_013300 [Thermobifida halotolerans]|uniref:DUF3558 domain-containing protein n=1 Tax=Thermobifida halotolerans TaxID=483545 RepID=A0AA97M206_9ACTN|nr:hypothetical protein NI17_013300 [Thermobifida halotolerans]
MIAGVIGGAAAVLAVAGLIVVFALRGGDEQNSDGQSPVAGQTREPEDEGSREPEESATPAPQGDFTTLPECAVAEHDELDRLVPGHSLKVEDVDTEGDDWWEGYHCTWTNANSSGDGNYYLLTIVVNDPLRYDTDRDLELYSGDYSTETVTGLGDGAVSWYDTENEVGCVATYLENLSLASCYDEMSGGRPLPETKAIEEAENLARATLDVIAQGDYR